MKRINKQQLFNWMQKYPLLGRAFGLLTLLLFPFIVIPKVIWENWDDIAHAFSETIAVTFLPWEDRK